MNLRTPYFGQEPVHDGKIEIAGITYSFTEWILAGNYGLRVWPCSVLLAQQLAKEEWAELKVCEVGAGLGLPGMVLANSGASVSFLDIDRVCCDWLKMTLFQNGVVGKVLHQSWADYQGDKFDSVIGSEMVYNDVPSLANFISNSWNRQNRCYFIVSNSRNIDQFSSELALHGIKANVQLVDEAYLVIL